MGLRESFEKTADGLFTSFDDFTEDVILKVPGPYDPTIGVTTILSKKTFKAYITDFSSAQIDGDAIRVNDKRAISKNLYLSSITPRSGMMLEVQGVDYEVISVSDKGTGGILTEMQIRGAV